MSGFQVFSPLRLRPRFDPNLDHRVGVAPIEASSLPTAKIAQISGQSFRDLGQ
jgi:hypothetical protein